MILDLLNGLLINRNIEKYQTLSVDRKDRAPAETLRYDLRGYQWVKSISK